MRLLRIGEGHYINIDAISSINCERQPYIQIEMNENQVYEFRYIKDNCVEFYTKLIEKIIDDEIKIVDIQQI